VVLRVLIIALSNKVLYFNWIMSRFKKMHIRSSIMLQTIKIKGRCGTVGSASDS